MPLPLKQFSPADTKTTQNGWAISIPFNSINCRAIIHNQSNTEFAVYSDQQDYIGGVPAGVLFVTLDIKLATSYLDFRPGNVVTSNVVPTNYVNGDIYAASEKKPDFQPVAMSRSVSVGNSVSTSSTDAIIATGQTDGLTVADISESPATNPAFYDALRPTNNTLGARGIEIDSLQTGTGYIPEIQIYNGVSILHGPLKLINAGIGQVFNEVTAGAQGVATVVGAPLLVNVLVVTQQTILDFAIANNGLYMVAPTMILGNGTSGNAVNMRVQYRNSAGLFVSQFKFINNNVESMAAGVTAFANGSWAGEPLIFYATTAAHIQVFYQDSTNAPNDLISVVLMRLA